MCSVDYIASSLKAFFYLIVYLNLGNALFYATICLIWEPRSGYSPADSWPLLMQMAVLLTACYMMITEHSKKKDTENDQRIQNIKDD